MAGHPMTFDQLRRETPPSPRIGVCRKPQIFSQLWTEFFTIKRMKWIVACLALIGTSMGVLGAEPEALLDDLRAELIEVDSKNASDSSSATSNNRLWHLPLYVLKNLPQGKYLTDELIESTQRQAEELSRSAPSEKAKHLAGELVSVLKERVEKIHQIADEKAEVEMRTAFEAGLAARTAQDLDVPLGTLYRLRQEMRARNRLAAKKLEFPVSILEMVQNSILSFKQTQAAGRRMIADQIRYLKSSNNNRADTLIPTLEIIAKLEALIDRIFGDPEFKSLSEQEIEDRFTHILKETKTLDDLRKAIAKVQSLNLQQEELGNFYGGRTGLVFDLRSLDDSYRRASRGLGGELLFFQLRYREGKNEKWIKDLKWQTLRIVLRTYLGAPEDQAIKKGEEIPDYLERMVAFANETGNLGLSERIASLSYIFDGSSRYNRMDRDAIVLFAGGKLLEQAHQYSAAVDSYLKARLGQPRLVPLNLIMESLVAIQRDHPDDYEAGVKLSESLPNH